MGDLHILPLACPTGAGWAAQERRRVEISRGLPCTRRPAPFDDETVAARLRRADSVRRSLIGDDVA